MYFGLVHYPQIEHKGFQSFREKYEPYSQLLPGHVPFVHPVPERHIIKVLRGWKPFRAHFCMIEKTRDHWLFLGA